METRLSIIGQWIRKSILFRNVIFSDGKSFCLDGPDNFYIWGKDNSTNEKKKSGGLIVHGLIGSYGYFPVVPITGSINVVNYMAILVAALDIKS